MKLSRLSIRARITGGSLLIAIVFSIVAGIVIYSQVERIVAQGQSRVLSSISGHYVTAVESADTAEFDPPGKGQFAAVVDPLGKVRLNSLPDALSERLGELSIGPAGVHIVHGDGKSFAVRQTLVETDAGIWHVIAASKPDDNVLDQVALLLVASIAAINVAFGAATWLIGSAALRPVSRLRRSAAMLAAIPSAEMLPVGPAKDEIADLAKTLNELISALRASADRERQIVSDASHEIRTPLAIIQARLELAQRQADSLDQMRVDVAAAQQAVVRLSSLATALLELSRIDAQAEPGRASLADLRVELADAADRGRLRVGPRDIRIEYTDAIGAAVGVAAVSVADFGRVCDNLVNNALAAMGGAGEIEITLTLDAGGILLTVSDTAGGMDPDYAPYALDRFSRGDVARTHSGAGLGLPIVAGIADTAGGAVRLVNTPGVGLLVYVTVPLVEESSGAEGVSDEKPKNV